MAVPTKSRIGLTGNALKLIALAAMTCDHIGAQLLPQVTLLRIIGRLAFPIFAYMIAEGCRYTTNKARYLGLMASLAFICQAVYFFAMHSLSQCILVTFSLSIGLIYIIDHAKKSRGTFMPWLLVVVSITAAWFITTIIPSLVAGFHVDYSFFGVLLPVFVFLGDTRKKKLLLTTLGLCLLSASFSHIQWFSLLAVGLLALYNGSRGKAKLKYLFYIYYPAHLVVIHLVSLNL